MQIITIPQSVFRLFNSTNPNNITDIAMLDLIVLKLFRYGIIKTIKGMHDTPLTQKAFMKYRYANVIIE